jgi:hypothetical protein
MWCCSPSRSAKRSPSPARRRWSLNDGGTATYVGGSGSTTLAFSYTVAAGQNTADLAVTAANLNGAIISDAAGNAADLSAAANNNPAGVLRIDTTAPLCRRSPRRDRHHQWQRHHRRRQDRDAHR